MQSAPTAPPAAPHNAAPAANLARLPPTRVLLDALRTPDAASRPLDVTDEASQQAGSRWRRWFLWMFWGGSTGAAMVLATVMVFRLYWRQPPPAGTGTLLYTLLGISTAALAILLLSLLTGVRKTLRHPLRALADRIDADARLEDALLLALRRLPPLALRARQRRIELQLQLWEGVSRTVLLLIALGPLAMGMVTGAIELPRKGGTLIPLLSMYGIAFVFGAALALFVQLQCSGPLRRLAHVLREAAEISTQLQRRDRAGEPG